MAHKATIEISFMSARELSDDEQMMAAHVHLHAFVRECVAVEIDYMYYEKFDDEYEYVVRAELTIA